MFSTKTKTWYSYTANYDTILEFLRTLAYLAKKNLTNMFGFYAS